VAVFQFCRQLGVEIGVAALIAAASVISRPVLFAAIMGKDDLFVAAFFLCALLALTPRRAAEPLDALRLGISLGLLLATKYTVLLSVPILLLAIDGPWRAGRRWRWWAAVFGLILLLAGPWYWRNLWLTRNPLFPLDVSVAGVHLFHGLFTAGRSEGLRSLEGIANVLSGGNYGLTPTLMATACVGWLAFVIVRARQPVSDPLIRVTLIGPVLGLGLFIWWSPFPEVRFVVPSFLLMFAGTAAACEALIRPMRVRQGVTLVVLAVAWWMAFGDPNHTLEFGAAGVVVALVGFVTFWLTRNWRPRLRLAVVGGGALILSVCFTFVYWAASKRAYVAAIFLPGSAWDLSYPESRPLWQFIAEHIPTDATIAYTNQYMVYPLQGFALDRKVVYAPTRPDVQSPADLPWLGDNLPGEELVPAAVRATVANPDRATWLNNLQRLSADYLVVGKRGFIVDAPEAMFAESDPKRFHKLYENDGGIVFGIDWSAE
jgi:hypothetical protein